jgi:hypothetical protein
MHFFPILLATLLAGCGGVGSTVPASDDATSRADERLLGFWRVDSTATPDMKDEGVFVVGKHKGSEKLFDLVTVSLNHEKSIELGRAEFLATSIEGKDHVSLRLLEMGSLDEKDAGVGDEKPDEKSSPQWIVLRYAMPDDDTLRVVAMSEKEAAADVRAGKIAGRVQESKGAKDAEPTLNVTLEATTTALRAYLDSRGEGVFKSDKPLVLRRLRLR